MKITVFVLQTFLSSVVSCIQVVEAGFLDNKLSLTVEDVCSMPVLEAHNTSSMGLNLMAHLPSIVRGFKPSLVTGKSSQEFRNSTPLRAGSLLNSFLSYWQPCLEIGTLPAGLLRKFWYVCIFNIPLHSALALLTYSKRLFQEFKFPQGA